MQVSKNDLRTKRPILLKPLFIHWTLCRLQRMDCQSNSTPEFHTPVISFGCSEPCPNWVISYPGLVTYLGGR